MEFFTWLEIIFLALFTGCLLYKYAAKEVGLGIKLLVYFSWFLSFSVVIILPLDIQNVPRSVYLISRPCRWPI